MSDPHAAAEAPDSALPSRTSIWAAAARALGARDPDPTVRNPDWLAERLIGPAERALLAEQRVVQALDQDYDVASSNYEALGPARALLVRTHFIDQKLEQAVRSGARQLVILGAGFDTRAYRLRELLKDLRVFEVDRPATQQYKQQRVSQVVDEIPSNLTYAPFDFRHEKVGDELEKAGYDPALKTFFIWEGVTMYLPEDIVRETFQWISSHAASGSLVVFDYVYRSTIVLLANVPMERLPSEAAKEAFLRWKRIIEKEPWISGLPDQGEREYLKSAGLEAREILAIGSADSEKRYLTRQDGSVFCAVPAGAQAQPQMYWLAEAVIPG